MKRLIMRKTRVKMLAVLLAMGLCAFALAGCGTATLSRPVPSDASLGVVVAGSCEIAYSGNVITVSGTIDVPDGAWIDVSIVAQNSTTIDHRTIQKSQAPISEQFTLSDEALEGMVDIQGFICFAPSYYHKQSNDIYTKYGNKFQNITNTENVVWNNEGIIVTYASGWLYGNIPTPTPGPIPSPTETSSAAVTQTESAAQTESAVQTESSTPSAS
jgi:hypothetical protein